MKENRSKIYTTPEAVLRELVENAETYSEILRNLGFHEMGGAPWRYLKARLKELNIDTGHFKGRAHGTSMVRKKKDEEIFVSDSNYTNKRSLKQRLLKDKIKEYKCERCNRNEWEGYPIPLELHHINGINNDNRIENLQFLCPNCHALTENYCGKNKYKK